jgi:predicted permease
MSSLANDFRLAVRMLGKSPLFTTIVVATLALAIGLNTAVFSAIDALLLRPLPGVRAAGEIVQLYRKWPEMDYGSNSIPHFYDLRNRTGDTFSGVALWSFNPFNVDFDGTPKRVIGSVVSANYFSLLGVTPAKGRFFVPQEDTGRLAHRVAVISHVAWQAMFGGDPQVVNRKVIVNGREYQIIGVTPPEFSGIITLITPTLWVPLMQLNEADPAGERQWEARDNNSFNVIARVRDGVSMPQVNERMATLVTQLRDLYPDAYRRSAITVVRQQDAGIHPMFRSAQMGLSAVVMAVVVILLLIACVNVANLFLARARDRAREMAVRLSLGASRASLVRQLLIESLMFAALAGAAGLGIAQWVISITNRISLPFDVDFTAGMSLSPTVLGFTLLTSVVTAVLFGIVPALQATRPSLIPALKGEEPAGESRSRMRSGLVVAQMAMSIVLLVCAGLFLRNLEAATAADKGFVSDNVLFADVDPGMQGYDRARAEGFYNLLRERLLARPGIANVAYAQILPLSLNESDTRVEVPGYTPRDNESMSVQYSAVGEGYFDAMGIKVTSGRPIVARDDSSAQRVLMVNQRFADKYFGGRDPVGSTVRTRRADHTIIGVVPTGKYSRLGEPPTAFMYFSTYQMYSSESKIVIRTTGDPNAAVPVLRAEVAALDPQLPLANVQSAARQLGIALLPARLIGAVLGVFGMLGLGLAAIGIYGVMAYSVSQRTREIGIRMAIGAAARDVVGLVMRQGAVLVAIGGGIGIVGALAASRALSGILYGGGENDVPTFIVVPVVLAAVAMVATWLPARRAANTDPLAALRQE